MTSPTSQPDMTRALLELGLRGAAAHIDDLVARATQRRWSPAQLVEELVRVESADRTHRSLERRRKRSKIASFKPMADFDWAWPSKLKRDLLERVLRLRFMQEAANVIVVGPHGLGKTMILANIAHEAIMAGHTVYYVTAAKLIASMPTTAPVTATATRALRRSMWGVGLFIRPPPAWRRTGAPA